MVQVQEESDGDEYPLYQIGSTDAGKPLQVEVTINGQALQMELDTGTAATLFSEKTFRDKWQEHEISLHPCTTKLRMYSGESLAVVGKAQVQVQYGEQQLELPLIVVEEEGISLFGRDWLSKLKLDWKKICDDP